MVTKLSFLSIILSLIGHLLCAQSTINLSGKWTVQLDTTNEMILTHRSQCVTAGIIELPASLAEKKYGYQTKGSDFGVLTPEYKYVGKAWYSREIIIPDLWKKKEIELFLERVLWESVVFIDGKKLSRKDALGTPHCHRLGNITPGKHELTIRIDNSMIHNIGDKGHAYGEYTQSIWNGIVGRMELRALEPTRIESVHIYPDIIKDEIGVQLEIIGDKKSKAKIDFEIVSLSHGGVELTGQEDVKLIHGLNSIKLKIPSSNQLKQWSEFTPIVYVLKMSLTEGKNRDNTETEFGFYRVSHNGTKILINGKPVFLRGNLDCVHFPLTGYPSCTIEDWERIFKIYKDYGLNHVRFHSWCPPEAAFKAADRTGIYIQAEASIWIDWWMSEDMKLRGRPEMDTRGHPKGLGYDSQRDQFVKDEMNRMIEAYGNHPSFTMFCIGNELGNSDFEVMEKWVADVKAKDPRRLYAVSTARKITPTDDYSATHYIQGVGKTRGLNGPRTDWDFEESFSRMDIPIIAHEIGQWPVYPRWTEIDKYTGVLKARNLLEFKAQAEKNGIADQSEEFTAASGALNQIMYKYETESFFRTASCAGVQLLSMQDYQGQGEALIGWLDAHWESKGITTPEAFKEHYNTTVPLLRMEKYVWTTDETFEAKVQISHHGQEPIQAKTNWSITDKKGRMISNGTFGRRTFALGSLNDLGKIALDLQHVKKAKKLTLSIEVEGTEFRNHWDIWVYPDKIREEFVGDILVVDKVDDKVKNVLQNGGKVLLLANELGTDEFAVNSNFYPLYWSLTFFPGQGKTNIGLLLQENHPAFIDFPTSFHSDWQWETISKEAKGFMLNDLPASYKPIAQPVDDFHRNNKLGSIFELKVSNGSLLVCGYDLNADLPVARQLKMSLINYMKSSDFDPQQDVTYLWVKKVFPNIPIAEKPDVPEQFDHAVLYVNAAVNAKEKSKSVPWNKGIDEVIVSKNTTYQLKSDGVWKDNTGAGWHGKQMELQINCPEGILGSLYIYFHDWNAKGRTGILIFEGRKVRLEKHEGEGQWVKFHVMREDSNDGKLILKTNAQSGDNLMITKAVLVKE